jgi:hypothetical protein
MCIKIAHIDWKNNSKYALSLTTSEQFVRLPGVAESRKWLEDVLKN